MTSKLKVNVISDGGDNNIITSNGSGVITSSKFKIGQILQNNFVSSQTTTATSFSDSGIALAITPTSTSSKVLIQVSIFAQITNATNEFAEGEFKIHRDSTVLDTNGRRVGGFATRGHGSELKFKGYQSFTLLDAPSTSSSVSYKIFFRSVNNTNETTFFGFHPSSITLMEVLP